MPCQVESEKGPTHSTLYDKLHSPILFWSLKLDLYDKNNLQIYSR